MSSKHSMPLTAPDESGADYRVSLKVMNNRLLSAIEATGYKSIPRFCDAFGVSYGSLLDLIRMKKSPLDRWGRWRQTSRQLSEVLGCLPEDLFNEQQMTSPLADNRREIEMTTVQLNNMLPVERDPHEIACNAQLQEKIQHVLEGLDPRLARILTLRFGLGDEEPLSRDELGKRIGISEQRVRQLEAKAMRKLRHPVHSNHLRSFLFDS